jgi:hypothetical protein
VSACVCVCVCVCVQVCEFQSQTKHKEGGVLNVKANVFLQ